MVDNGWFSCQRKRCHHVHTFLPKCQDINHRWRRSLLKWRQSLFNNQHSVDIILYNYCSSIAEDVYKWECLVMKGARFECWLCSLIWYQSESVRSFSCRVCNSEYVWSLSESWGLQKWGYRCGESCIESVVKASLCSCPFCSARFLRWILLCERALWRKCVVQSVIREVDITVWEHHSYF